MQLNYIDHYLASKFAYLRFNFQTGDAAGMNMVGKATFAACNWILQNCDVVEIQRFFLESNFATDKKASMINMMRTRGKRVVAEAVVKRDVLLEIMDAETESIYYHGKIANLGSTAVRRQQQRLSFRQRHHRDVPCDRAGRGQRLGILDGLAVLRTDPGKRPLHVHHPALTDRGHLRRRHRASHAKGITGVMGCYGQGKVYKFAEIVAGTVLAGEISLAAAISSLDWVSSHDQYGRNDPGAAS